jgi:hypothetical protein
MATGATIKGSVQWWPFLGPHVRLCAQGPAGAQHLSQLCGEAPLAHLTNVQAQAHTIYLAC